jgi:hypothetical protein
MLNPMRFSVAALSLSLSIAVGCTPTPSSPISSNPTAPIASAPSTTPIVAASTEPISTSSVSPTATSTIQDKLKTKNSFPQEFTKRFFQSCIASPSTKDNAVACNCILDKLQDNFTFEEYSKIVQNQAGKEDHTKAFELIESCKKQ